MPSYNHEALLGRALQSVVGQTFEDFEIVVVDDGSTDRSADVAEEIARHEPRIRFIKRTLNIGRQRTLLEAVSHCRGNNLAFLASDDEWAPEKLELQAHALRSGAAFVYTQGRRALEGVKVDSTEFARSPDSELSRFERLFVTNYIPASSVAVSRKLYEIAGGFSEGQLYEDLSLWLRCLALEPAAFLDSMLVTYRVGAGSVDSRIHAAGRDLRAYGAAVFELAGWPALPPQLAEMVASWARCWQALLALDEDVSPATFARLSSSDTERFARLYASRHARFESRFGDGLEPRTRAAVSSAPIVLQEALRHALVPTARRRDRIGVRAIRNAVSPVFEQFRRRR